MATSAALLPITAGATTSAATVDLSAVDATSTPGRVRSRRLCIGGGSLLAVTALLVKVAHHIPSSPAQSAAATADVINAPIEQLEHAHKEHEQLLPSALPAEDPSFTPTGIHRLPVIERSLPTDASCYTISGGMTFFMGVAGDYQRMEGTDPAHMPMCGGHSVFRFEDKYLFMADGTPWWQVGDKTAMEACAAAADDIGVNYMQGKLSSGDWWARTGVGTKYHSCASDEYCHEANTDLQVCSPS